MSEEILQVVDLKKYFAVKHGSGSKRRSVMVKAVDGVSFNVHRGETFGLVGESGSGKSTVAYTTIGMYQPTAGSILFRDKDLFAAGKKRPLDLRKQIQIVWQDPGGSLNPRQSIQQILELPLRIHQPDRANLQGLLELLDLVDLPPEYLYKLPNMLSGGEKQIVGIARALATAPSLIILDEPTSALDVSMQGKIINLLMRLQRELHLSFLFITHDLSLMRNVASRVAIMYLGKIVEVAETAEFFQNPQHPYTQMLLSSIPVLTEAEEALKPQKIHSMGEIPSPVDVPPGCGFQTRCPYVMEVCRKVEPGMVETGPGHTVRCFLFAEEIGVAGAPQGEARGS